ncbi:MAG: tRNA pseudouridine(55) synthase TruB [Rhabdochlamydiaceae bacterium]|nr:tRNA pseudouridine(55) synthase TruB [Rhabdochlamydiaceae bacterium]
MLRASDHITGILPLNKPAGKTSFAMVALLRKATGIQKIGHAGTLDPFATGVMVMLIGKEFTKLSDQFLHQDKEYHAKLHLGIATDTYDCDGQVIATSSTLPTLAEIEEALLGFQGTILQTPPMFSAKKVAGKKLYELARKGITIEREPVPVTLRTTILNYAYPYLEIHVHCTKGTYIRTLAHEIGLQLNCGAHLCALTRTRSGTITLDTCCDGSQILDPYYLWQDYLLASIPL